MFCVICGGTLVEMFPFGHAPKVIRCRSCHTESLRPLPTSQELAQHYDNYEVTNTAEDQVEFLCELSIKSLGYYCDRMDLNGRPTESLRLLEVGFGNGAAVFAAAKLGMQSFGVDLDGANVQRGKVFAARHSLPVKLICGDESEVQRFGMNFDLVKASQILEHVIDPLKFLTTIAKVQPTGGYLIIECPNNDSVFWIIKNRFRKSFKRMNYYNSLKLKEHLWGYTKKSLPILMEKAGYRIVFLQDYASGDAIFEPQSVLWYPTMREGIRLSVKRRTLHFLLYPSARLIDGFCATVMRSGTSLAALCQKVET